MRGFLSSATLSEPLHILCYQFATAKLIGIFVALLLEWNALPNSRCDKRSASDYGNSFLADKLG